MGLKQRVIDRLAELEFRIQVDWLRLFGETLPLLQAIAVDDQDVEHRAHQLVLVAEQDRRAAAPDEQDDEYDEPWRELLFAVGGLRHHLRGPLAPALGSPILLAIVEGHGASRLHRIAEEIAEEYALFSRIDISIVDAERIAEGDEDALDWALASLLPCTRRALAKGTTVAAQDVEHFWNELGREVSAAAGAVADDFGKPLAIANADRIMAELRRDDDRPVVLPRKAQPVSGLMLESFRSFERASIDLSPVSIIYGANGSGKTSICEALEILWSGRTQRIPDGVTGPAYAKHLNHNGNQFSIRHWPHDDADEGKEPPVAEIAEHEALPLGRMALAQHVLTKMASGTPAKRFQAFLDASGLTLPDLGEKVEKLRTSAFEEANEVLVEAELGRLAGINRNARKHLRNALASSFAAELPRGDQVEGAAEALRRVTGSDFAPSQSLLDPALPGLLEDVDAAIKGVCSDFDRAADPSPRIDAAIGALRRNASALRELADPLRMLAQQLSRAMPLPLNLELQEATGPLAQSPVPAPTVARWLSHVRGLEQSVPELEGMGRGIEDLLWRKRLQQYGEALRTAIERSSVDELEKMEIATPGGSRPTSPPAAPQLDLQLVREAGFTRAPELSRPVIAAMGEMQAQLAQHAAQVDSLATTLTRHPVRSFVSRAARIMPVLCRFELARELTKPRGALARARGTLVFELLDQRLFPVVRELVAALVRFEWYFEPLGMEVDSNGMRLTGGANSKLKQDVRMLFNAAERTAVGIAWFLALHMLQPKTDRKVLVLDDPASGFDPMNKAAFVATLRSVLRLIKPEQLLITTHDDELVTLLEQELAAIDGWPETVGFIRCRRTDVGDSEAVKDRQRLEQLGKADLRGELRKLSLAADDLPSRA